MKQFSFNEKFRKNLKQKILISLGLIVIAVPVFSQEVNNKVKGVVLDEAGNPIIGTTVIVKGTNNGTITDIDGKFILDVPENAVLEVSYIGYTTQVVNVSGQDLLNITLKEDTQSLEEVVVVGFATQKKVNLTGSVGMATAKDLESRPVSNVVNALQGVIPGLNISNTSGGGELNSSKSIDVRGTGTIGSGSSGAPLILIDGMEGDLNSLNPQDVESISVLKDAAASSIYGSRAPFGVVLVTTKSGKSGRAQVNYNVNVRYNTPVKMPDIANSWEFVNYFDEAQFNSSNKHLFDESYKQMVYDYMIGKTTDYIWGEGPGGKWNYDYPTANVDWLDQYYRTWSPSHEHNLSVSGGNDKITYYVSTNYLGQEGFMRYGTDNYKRYTLTGKVSAKVADNLKVEYSNRWVRTDYDKATYMNDEFYDNVLRRCRPTRPIYDPNGYYMSDINYIDALENGGRNKEQKDVLSQQAKITFTPLENWNIIGEMNIKIDNSWNHIDELMVYAHYKDNPELTYKALTSANMDKVSEESDKSTYLNPTVFSNYSFSLKEKHNFVLLAGFQMEMMKYRLLSASRTGMITTDLPVLDLTTDTDNYTMSGLYKNWSNVGFFGRINYDFLGKYLLELNLRYDGSSRFRREHRWIWTPSFSLGWNIARENFWESLSSSIETFKLRVSYGELANQNTTEWYPTYQIINVQTNAGSWLQNGNKTDIASVPGLISPTLTWENIKNTNIGLDFGALNNRLTGSFDYFWRKTLNMVGPGVELPAILGTSVPKTNNCDLTTFGWELQLGWRDKINDFAYGVKFNLSDSQTRIDNYPNPTNSLTTFISGHLTDEIYGYETIGIAKTQEEMDKHLASLPNGGQTALGSKWEAGDVMYADLNGDGKISKGSNTLDDMGDLKKIGSKKPRFVTGVSFDAQYKGFDFSMFWQGVLKRDYAPETNSLIFWGANRSEWDSAAFVDHLDYFRPADTTSPLGPNVDGYYPRPTFDKNFKNNQPQTRYLQNAAYMRLKNIQLGYTIPKSLINKIGIQNLRVFISGENLLTITSLSNTLDPETIGVLKTNRGTVYPLSKTYSFGLSVNF